MPSKNSHSGPKAALTQVELAALEKEVNAYRPVRQPGIDETVRAWFRVYHSVVLLAAAIDLPQSHSLNEQDG